ncbi:U-box domain-containing protein 6-like [Mercurialis annua]|uniref:U-box domain-containing protein 6-like n=1 Tax=Mercurialis annua TaxID=3986 RepID=UPI0021607524|nr:U-box domain-containing protein 6-like [Mercurialis annua]XP_050208488.1 U-box domain-containing protein 6-like [Mercurialis annua]
MWIMDITEVEENLFAASDAKLHGEMCKALSAIYCKILSIFPSLEGARPRSKSGIQALCSLHIALEKAKNILQHCSECSKLYLAITCDSVLLKFEKARSALVDSLRRVEDIVPQSIGCQILEIVSELEGIIFLLAPSEKQVGDEIISLLQQGRKFDDCPDNNELESFHQAATKLGITSSRAALTERRALKKLIERARVEEDKRKESIVAYLLHLMRKYSKLFRSELTDDNDSQGSTPCSPTVLNSFDEAVNGHAFDRQLSKLGSFNFKPNNRKSGNISVPPEELRCPISLQLMYDPVIIASGQTYERICIEKWFSDGHDTCPKTQQKLCHLCLTPNYCVKGLVTSWCEQNGVPVPDGPPDSLDLNYFRLSLCQSESANSRSVESISSGKGIKVVPLEENCTIEESEHNEMENSNPEQEEVPLEENHEEDMFQRFQIFLTILNKEGNLRKKCKVVEKIRLLLKDDEEARICMGANGFGEALLRYLESAVHAKNAIAQEIGAMALFNLAVNNNRNKEMLLASGVIPMLEMMISSSESHGAATALYLNLSCLEEAKSIIGSSEAVPFLVKILQGEDEPQCKMDALHTLYNISSQASNIQNLLSAGITSGLQSLLAAPGDLSWTEKLIAVLINLASSKSGKEEMVSTPGLIGGLATILDMGEPIEQEQAASCLYILCNGSENCSQLVLQEGVIPALVSISVNGTTRGKEKAQKLLMLFREQRQRDPAPQSCGEVRFQRAESSSKAMPPPESNPLCKSVSRRKMGKALSFFWKSKSYSVYQC